MWCFTLYRDDPPTITDGIDYMCFQQERCPTTGNLHWQGYMELNYRARPAQARALVNTWKHGTHVERTRGSQQEAIDYTKKNDTAVPDTWREIGHKHHPDAVHMLDALVNDIRSGQLDMNKLVSSHEKAYLMYGARLMPLLDAKRPPPPEWRKVEVFLYWGASGTGKTRKAQAENPGAYHKNNTEWWNGYTDQTCVVFDDFFGQQKYSDMQLWLEGYVTNLQVKGSPLAHHPYWTKVIITSNRPIWEWWAGIATKMSEDERLSIFRRVPAKNRIRFKWLPDGSVSQVAQPDDPDLVLLHHDEMRRLQGAAHTPPA